MIKPIGGWEVDRRTYPGMEIFADVQNTQNPFARNKQINNCCMNSRMALSRPELVPQENGMGLPSPSAAEIREEMAY